MPRTRQRKQTPVSPEPGNLLLKDFQKQVDLRIHKMKSDFKLQLQRLNTEFDVALARIPPAIAKLTLGEILAMRDVNDDDRICEVSSSVNNDTHSPEAKTVKAKRIVARTTAASDDGYATEGGTTALHQSRVTIATASKPRNTRKTRSSSRDSRAKVSEMVQPVSKTRLKPPDSSTKFNKFKTPAGTKPQNSEYSIITPKVKPNTPMSIMRRPRQGEMAVSMQGSPLLVTSIVNEQTANVTVPMKNGDVFSLLPNDGLRRSAIPTLDPETLRQLQTLQRHLDKVIGPQ